MATVIYDLAGSTETEPKVEEANPCLPPSEDARASKRAAGHPLVTTQTVEGGGWDER